MAGSEEILEIPAVVLEQVKLYSLADISCFVPNYLNLVRSPLADLYRLEADIQSLIPKNYVTFNPRELYYSELISTYVSDQVRSEQLRVKRGLESFKRRYYALIRSVKSTSDAELMHELQVAFLQRMRELKNLFARCNGKLRSISQALSFSHFNLDIRTILQKKNKLIFARSDSEDHI